MSETAEKTTDQISSDYTVKHIDHNSDPNLVKAYDHFVASASGAYMAANFVCPGFADMSDHEKVQMMVNGTLAGIIAIAMSKMNPESRDKAIQFIKEAADPAGANAKNLLKQYELQLSQQVREREGCKPGEKLN